MLKSKTETKIKPMRETKIHNEIKPYQTKKILPVHQKIYESSLQENNFIKKVEIPQSHPSFLKDDGTNPIDRYTLYNSRKTVVIGYTPMKKIKIEPMHQKLYESVTQRGDFIKKVDVPQSHPTYNKKDYTYRVPNTISFEKKIDLYKTTYNFLNPGGKN
jgi:hypothetical protein